MGRIVAFAYGVTAYLIFFAVFLYLVGFVNDLVVPKSVSSGEPGSWWPALPIDLGLLALFGVQHSVMARSGFKRWLTLRLSPAIERSTYVMATNVVLIALFAGWQPLPGTVWAVDGWAATALGLLAASGWALGLAATFLTDHFDLFGLRQVWLGLLRRSYQPVPFREWLFYRSIRHPMMTGLLLAFWATPVMSASHLLFALGMTVYVLIGVHYEERGLVHELGQPYRDYMARTGRFLPFA